MTIILLYLISFMSPDYYSIFSHSSAIDHVLGCSAPPVAMYLLYRADGTDAKPYAYGI
jgi:hypothetical protein